MKSFYESTACNKKNCKLCRSNTKAGYEFRKVISKNWKVDGGINFSCSKEKPLMEIQPIIEKVLEKDMLKSGSCFYLGEKKETIEKKCCGGKIKKIDMFYCNKLNKVINPTSCLNCKEYKN